MAIFRTIDELVRALNREQVLLKEMFVKRKSLSFRRSFAEELLDYKQERIRFLIDHGVIRDNGDFLELEDVYLKFFEEVLEVNEEINVSAVKDYISRLNENIDYFLKENNERRKYGYQREVKRLLKTIALSTMRNVVDLKRNVDNTYKNEPNYHIKKTKLHNLDEKRNGIALLIKECERLIDEKQKIFFTVAMDVQMRQVVSDVRYQLNESYHNLIEIDKQIINYLNLIEYQNKLLKKIQLLKYLRDQLTIVDNTDIEQHLSTINPVWMEPQAGFRLKVSLDALRSSDEALEVLKSVIAKMQSPNNIRRNLADAISREYLDRTSETIELVDQEEMMNAFSAQGKHLFAFVMNYHYKIDMNREARLVLFCQIASQYSEHLEFTKEYGQTDDIEYPIIYPA